VSAAADVAVIRPRRVSFDWEGVPLHWIPDDPGTSHVINVLHLLLPAGEKWFVEVYREALPKITDPVLREQVKGFMGQEAIHGRAHQAVLDHFAARGLDPAPYTRRIDWLFQKLLSPARVPRPLRGVVLRQRLAVIAAIEHFTCVLGQWILHAEALDRAGAHPRMLDLLRWHGAEEVEHRSVAFDLAEHLGGRLPYVRRVTVMVAVAVAMTVCWHLGVRFMIRQDPTWPAGARYSVRHGYRAARRGLLPMRELVVAVPRYLRRSYHPAHEGTADAAVAYLARSPAVAATR
jgi:uncharacterized protein